MNHRQEVDRQLLEAGGDPAALFQPAVALLDRAYRGTVAFRSGYRKELGSQNDPLSGATFGLGAGHNGMWMDYGYVPSTSGGGEHRIGLRFDLGHLGMGDSFGQNDMPRDFDSAKDNSLIGPPEPRKKR